MEPSRVADTLEHFLRTQYGIAPDDPGFSRTTDLMDAGYVDSIAVVEVLAFIASEFGTEIPEQDLVSDEFTTIDGMAHVIARLIAADGGASGSDSVAPSLA